jgi:hypothetical protein
MRLRLYGEERAGPLPEKGEAERAAAAGRLRWVDYQKDMGEEV